jgi:hypothetical protein
MKETCCLLLFLYVFHLAVTSWILLTPRTPFSPTPVKITSHHQWLLLLSPYLQSCQAVY